MAGASSPCIFCQIARSYTSTTLLHSGVQDDKVVAFQDINPSAFRHYLVIPVEHIATVKDLQRRAEDYSLVGHMLNVGQTLLHRDAPHSMEYRYLFLYMKKCVLIFNTLKLQLFYVQP
ncbi:Bifunctional adenosine 5'-phosphosulfate phosphorylase/adenylylsulfatase HINT4 [Vitis vinifera]|uniref:Bifunctional adenosine 5'-phosphosulfate phosphorylase/adenylylsulfatase HINT4 n=1 Tax=Vitis vinifera TaxID=29760 RepID=A0A438ES28_VITVI|nr:Bifunctional adenosine 5'-phosphosulfate phosphorylase/adenylylsulfatase HINT4 [Vitis vinifera]RVX15564.1 Bifunctional adenosine 5'-phosphosulfate phosphorylase/adenylylsulfatase HINT4 [Vitis vinifera]